MTKNKLFDLKFLPRIFPLQNVTPKSISILTLFLIIIRPIFDIILSFLKILLYKGDYKYKSIIKENEIIGRAHQFAL